MGWGGMVEEKSDGKLLGTITALFSHTYSTHQFIFRKKIDRDLHRLQNYFLFSTTSMKISSLVPVWLTLFPCISVDKPGRKFLTE